MALSRSAKKGPRTGSEKRKEGRSPLTLTGRLYFPDRNLEEVCRIFDLSPSGAGLKSAASAPIGTRVVLYAEEFGRFEGVVVWRNRTMLGLEFRGTEKQRIRTAEQLAIFLANGGKFGLGFRRTARYGEVPDLREIVTSSGEHIPCEVKDIALGGAALKSAGRPAIGEIVRFGETSGRVLRHLPDGFVVTFEGAVGGKFGE